MVTKEGITVIVCCYNSEKKIKKTISHLKTQVIPDNFELEIIIVNNASEDNTKKAVVAEWGQEAPKNCTLRIIDQLTPGLSNARIKGAKAAKYEIILFCDDDNWLDRCYISNAYKAISQNERIGIIGGIGLPVTDAEEYPNWFNKLHNVYAVGPQGKKSGRISPHQTLYGAGMVTRKKLFLNCYPNNFKSLLSDRKGKELTSGGDTEYCLRIKLMNYELHYSPSLTFRHLIPTERLTEDYKHRILKGTEDAQKELRRYVQLAQYRNKNAIWRSFRLCKTILGYLSGKILNRPSWNLNDVIRAVFYATRIDLGIDEQTQILYNHYSISSTNSKKELNHTFITDFRQ